MPKCGAIFVLFAAFSSMGDSQEFACHHGQAICPVREARVVNTVSFTLHWPSLAVDSHHGHTVHGRTACPQDSTFLKVDSIDMNMVTWPGDGK